MSSLLLLRRGVASAASAVSRKAVGAGPASQSVSSLVAGAVERRLGAALGKSSLSSVTATPGAGRLGFSSAAATAASRLGASPRNTMSTQQQAPPMITVNTAAIPMGAGARALAAATGIDCELSALVADEDDETLRRGTSSGVGPPSRGNSFKSNSSSNGARRGRSLTVSPLQNHLRLTALEAVAAYTGRRAFSTGVIASQHGGRYQQQQQRSSSQGSGRNRGAAAAAESEDYEDEAVDGEEAAVDLVSDEGEEGDSDFEGGAGEDGESTADKPIGIPLADVKELAAFMRKRLQEENITTLFPVQQSTISHALKGQDILVRSMTGSGKTLGFAIPIVHSLIEEDANGTSTHRALASRRRVSIPRAIILAPTRELAKQVEGEFYKLTKGTKVRSLALYGGASVQEQEKILKGGVDIVVGTPGRIIDFIERGSLDLSKCRFACLDEADEMLRMGFQDDVETIFKELPPPPGGAKTKAKKHDDESRDNNSSSKQEVALDVDEDDDASSAPQVVRTTMLWSATVPTWVRSIAASYCNKPTFIDLVGDSKAKLSPTASFRCHLVTAGARLDALTAVLVHTLKHKSKAEKEKERLMLKQGASAAAMAFDLHKRVLVFSDTKRECRELYLACQQAIASPGSGGGGGGGPRGGVGHYKMAEITGDMSQAARETSMEDFRKGRVQVLFATDVAARGIDIPSVDAVVHYRLPRDQESFVHRSGRTARAGKKGEVVVLIEPSEIPMFSSWEKRLQFDAKVAALPKLDPETLIAEALSRVLATLRNVPSSLASAVKSSQLWKLAATAGPVSSSVPASGSPSLTPAEANLQDRLAVALGALALGSGGGLGAAASDGDQRRRNGGSTGGVPGLSLATSLLTGERGFVTMTLYPYSDAFKAVCSASGVASPPSNAGAASTVPTSQVSAMVLAFCNAFNVSGTDRPRRAYVVPMTAAAAGATAASSKPKPSDADSSSSASSSSSDDEDEDEVAVRKESEKKAASLAASKVLTGPSIVFDLPASVFDAAVEKVQNNNAPFPAEVTRVLPASVKTAAFGALSPSSGRSRDGRSGGDRYGSSGRGRGDGRSGGDRYGAGRDFGSRSSYGDRGSSFRDAGRSGSYGSGDGVSRDSGRGGFSGGRSGGGGFRDEGRSGSYGGRAERGGDRSGDRFGDRRGGEERRRW